MPDRPARLRATTTEPASTVREAIARHALPSEPADATSERAARLYASMARYAFDEAECWPSRDTLAADLGCNVRTVGRALGDLIASGWVRVAGKRRGRHGWDHNVYELMAPYGVSGLAAQAITRRASRRSELRASARAKIGRGCPTNRKGVGGRAFDVMRRVGLGGRTLPLTRTTPRELEHEQAIARDLDTRRRHGPRAALWLLEHEQATRLRLAPPSFEEVDRAHVPKSLLWRHEASRPAASGRLCGRSPTASESPSPPSPLPDRRSDGP